MNEHLKQELKGKRKTKVLRKIQQVRQQAIENGDRLLQESKVSVTDSILDHLKMQNRDFGIDGQLKFEE